MLEINSKVQNNAVTVFVCGRIDSGNADIFDKGIESAVTDEKLIIDMDKLEYISSAGLRIILKYRKSHPDIEIINASTEVYEIMDMTGFNQMMTVKRRYRTVSVEGCEVIGQGANGKVYRIDPDTVVKVYLNPDSFADIEHEREVARKALVLGVPTAISYDIVKVEDHYASMFEMLNAKSFSKLIAEKPEDVDTYAKLYTDLLLQIHAIEVPKGQLPDQREVFIGWVRDIEKEFTPELYAKLIRMAEEIPHDDHMIHGDYHTKNLMLQNGEVILIDMDTLAIGHPVLEFASIYNAYLGFTAVDHSVAQSFLGFPYETGVALWKKTLEYYFGTTDEKLLDLREKQAKAAGLVRLLRRSAGRAKDPVLADYCRRELTALIEELESFVK